MGTFLGQLNEDQRDITWKTLKPMKKPRKRHIAFKINENLYVAGGLDARCNNLSDCERYSIKDNEWKECDHSLPNRLHGAVVSLSSDQSFAVLTGGQQETGSNKKILLFTEKEGFKYLNDIKMKHGGYI